MKAKLEESSKLLVKSEKDSSKQRKKQKDLEASLTDSNSQVTFWKGSATEAQSKCKTAEEQLEFHKSEAESLLNSRDELVVELKEAKTTSDQLHSAALTFEEDHKRLSQENQELEDRHHQLLTQLGAATTKQEDLQKQVQP